MEQSMSRHASWLYYGLAVLLVFMWGGTFVSTKVLLAELHPVTIMFLRCCIAWGVLFLFHPKFHKPVSLSQELLFLGCGVTGFTVYFLLENYALAFASASSVSLLVTLAPIFTILLMGLWERSMKITWWQLLGFLLAFSGVFLVVRGEESGVAAHPLLGGVLAVGAAFSWSLYSLCLRWMRSPYPQVYITRKIFFYAIVTIMPCMLFIPGTGFSLGVLADLSVAGNLLFLGLGASALGYVCWNVCVKVLGSARTSNLIYFIPLVTVLLSAVILRETITVHTVLGAALIVSGVVVGEKIGKKGASL